MEKQVKKVMNVTFSNFKTWNLSDPRRLSHPIHTHTPLGVPDSKNSNNNDYKNNDDDYKSS